MKKIITLLIAVIMLLTFAGCENNGKTQSAITSSDITTNEVTSSEILNSSDESTSSDASTSSKPQDDNTSKPQSVKPNTNNSSKPNTNINTSSKPNTNTNTSSKPNTNTNTNTSSKPNNNNGTSTSTPVASKVFYTIEVDEAAIGGPSPGGALYITYEGNIEKDITVNFKNVGIDKPLENEPNSTTFCESMSGSFVITKEWAKASVDSENRISLPVLGTRQYIDTVELTGNVINIVGLDDTESWDAKRHETRGVFYNYPYSEPIKLAVQLNYFTTKDIVVEFGDLIPTAEMYEKYEIKGNKLIISSYEANLYDGEQAEYMYFNSPDKENVPNWFYKLESQTPTETDTERIFKIIREE